MTRGAPDGIVPFANVGYLGQGIHYYSFAQLVLSDDTALIPLPAPVENTENIYLKATCTVGEDEFIHFYLCSRVADAYIWAIDIFCMSTEMDLNTVSFAYGTQAQVKIYNNADTDLTFYGVIYWVVRSIL